MSSQAQAQSGPPYASQHASNGGLPTLDIDVAICAVFVVLFAGAAAGNQAVYQMNRRKGHKFIPSLAMFGFCMARILTLALRMAWSTHQTNVSLAIAANIFVNAGILIVYVLNLLFAQRILRATHPSIGWHRATNIVRNTLFALVALALVLVITFTVLSMYTLDADLQQKCRDVQLAAGTYLLVFTVVPLLILPLGLVRSNSASQQFGKGNTTAKVVIVFVSSFLCLIEQIYRTATSWEPLRPRDDPAWFQSRAAFYCFNFVIEILVIYFLLLARVDQRFHVPDGSSKVKHYHGASAEEKAAVAAREEQPQYESS